MGKGQTLFEWATPAGVTPPQVGAVLLDASINEQHVASAQITSHQVETGADVSDHIRPMPRRLTVEMMITDTPIRSLYQVQGSKRPSIIGTDRSIHVAASSIVQVPISDKSTTYVGGQEVTYKALAFDAQFQRVRDVYGDLVNACLAGAMFKITTTLTVYAAADGSNNMAIANFSVPRSAAEGNVLHGTVDFQEVRFASTKEVMIQPTAKKKNGAKATTEVTETSQPKKSSVLNNGAKKVGI